MSDGLTLREGAHGFLWQRRVSLVIIQCLSLFHSLYGGALEGKEVVEGQHFSFLSLPTSAFFHSPVLLCRGTRSGHPQHSERNFFLWFLPPPPWTEQKKTHLEMKNTERNSLDQITQRFAPLTRTCTPCFFFIAKLCAVCVCAWRYFVLKYKKRTAVCVCLCDCDVSYGQISRLGRPTRESTLNRLKQRRLSLSPIPFDSIQPNKKKGTWWAFSTSFGPQNCVCSFTKEWSPQSYSTWKS